MNKSITRRTSSIAAALTAAVVLLTGCTGSSKEDDARDALQAQKATGETLEKTNLAAKQKLEENKNAIGYLYILNYGQIVGYYVTKGKISNSSSQRTPEDDSYWTCKSNHGCQPVVVDGPQDDGSYGGGDPGIFFFLADSGAMVVTSLDYLYSTQPLPQAVDAPLLGGK